MGQSCRVRPGSASRAGRGPRRQRDMNVGNAGLYLSLDAVCHLWLAVSSTVNQRLNRNLVGVRTFCRYQGLPTKFCLLGFWLTCVGDSSADQFQLQAGDIAPCPFTTTCTLLHLFFRLLLAYVRCDPYGTTGTLLIPRRPPVKSIPYWLLCAPIALHHSAHREILSRKCV